MVEQSSEPLLLPFPGCLSHTAQSLGHSFPALSRACVGLSDVFLGPRPFLPCLRRGKRSEEHTSELQSRLHIVCRLLLEKKKKKLYQVSLIRQKTKNH